MKSTRRILSAVMVLAVLLALCGCECDHDWEKATCKDPKTCTKCGETTGDAKGHDWEENEDGVLVCSRCDRVKSQKDDDDETGDDTASEALPVYETREVYLCVRTTMEQWDGSGTSVTEYEYDAYGNKVRETNVSSGRSTAYTYDANGNCIISQSYDGEGTPGGKAEMVYDEEGRLLHQTSYYADGEAFVEYVYTYDEAGYVVEEVRNQYYSDTTCRYVLSYNADHTQATITVYENDEPNGYTEETYDANGNVEKSDTYRQDGTWTSGLFCEYDAQGRLAVEWKYSSSETQADYDVIYTYDENGLLIHKNVDYYYGYGMTYEYELFEIQVRVN